MVNTLATLFTEHVGKTSDKWALYIAEYDRLFLPYQERPIRLLEIGIQNGGSLEIWVKYFGKGEIFIGCDINPDCTQLVFDNPRIVVVVSDANDYETQQKIYNLSPSFDIIIDDGSHLSSDIIISFTHYFERLDEGGLYIIEDLHCSYWESFEGGLYDPLSSMAFLKDLADIINFEHWGIDKSRKEFLNRFNHKYSIDFDEVVLAYIHSVEFINSTCVIRKQKPADNNLGRRCIVGMDAKVVAQESIGFNGSSALKQNQLHNPWAKINLLEENQNLKKNLEISHQKIEELSKSYAILEVTFSESNRQIKEKYEMYEVLQLQNIEHQNTIKVLTKKGEDDRAIIESLRRQDTEHQNTIKVLTKKCEDDRAIIENLEIKNSQTFEDLFLLRTKFDKTLEELLEIKKSKFWRYSKLFRKLEKIMQGK